MLLSKRKTITNQKRNLITFTNPDSIISEQFRTLRTNIHISTNKKKSIILLTSPKAGDGKSTAIANLAVSMALQKEKVLLIDANLREPYIQFIFKLGNEKGLADILTNNASFKDVVHHTEIGKLAVLTSGQISANPAELLGSEKMEELLKSALEEYDVILLDSPPVLEVTDTKLLASKCDGVILVLSQGRTALEKALDAKKALDFAKANLYGVILNEN